MALTTIRRTRALAGQMAKRVVHDVVGTGNGVNTVFAPVHFGFIISPTQDIVSAADVRVCVNDEAVGVASVTESIVVLSNAPASGSTVTMDYWGSNLSNAEISTFIAEVDAQVLGSLYQIYSVEELATSPLIGKISAYLAAAAMDDEAYDTGGQPTGGAIYPADRLRKIGNDLLAQVLAGIITLLDADNLPLVQEVENWIAKSNYDEKDRVFESDPFNLNRFGNPEIETTRTPFDWE